LAVVSNTPWGSPSELWRKELERLGIENAVDTSIFCVDVGWRKPAPIIFKRVLETLNVKAEECLFIGDERVWDVEGARTAGMPAVLIDPMNRHPYTKECVFKVLRRFFR
jgi:putative hydrolase of the HAD superfamily